MKSTINHPPPESWRRAMVLIPVIDCWGQIDRSTIKPTERLCLNTELLKLMKSFSASEPTVVIGESIPRPLFDEGKSQKSKKPSFVSLSQHNKVMYCLSASVG